MRDFADPLTVLYVPFYGPAITPTNNANLGQVNDTTLNAAMVKARADRSTRPHGRRLWANVDKMLVNQAVRGAGGLRQPAEHLRRQRSLGQDSVERGRASTSSYT